MGTDASFGMIIYRWQKGQPLFLIIKHQVGHWDFPKGHPEGSEEPLESAQREVAEEAGLTDLKIEKLPPFEEKYSFKIWGRRIQKTVTLWLAESTTADVQIQATEIAEFKWVTLAEGQHLITFEVAKQLLTKAHEYLQSK